MGLNLCLRRKIISVNINVESLYRIKMFRMLYQNQFYFFSSGHIFLGRIRVKGFLTQPHRKTHSSIVNTAIMFN